MPVSVSSATPDPHRLVLQAVNSLSNHAEPFPSESVGFLVDLVRTVGWDVNAKLTQEHPLTVVGMIASHPRGKRDLVASQSYPIDLDQFLQSHATLKEVESPLEWFMAFTVASGFNPWPSKDEAFPSALLHDLVIHQYWGVLEQLCQLPGAPDIHSLLGQDLGHYGKGDDSRFATLLVSAGGGDEGLRRLLRLSKSGSYDPPKAVWAAARKETLEVLLSQASFPTNAAEVRSIEKRWSSRVKTKELTGEDYAAMVEASAVFQNPEQKPASTDDIKAFGLIKESLGVGWGKSLDNKPGLAAPTEKGLSVEFLTRPLEVVGTAMDGVWTPVSACLMRNLRGLGYLECVQGLEYAHWQLASYSYPGWQIHSEGGLAPALDVEWRPGISQGGLAALAFLGRQVTGITLNEDYEAIQKGDFSLGNDLLVEMALFGIKDMKAFADLHRESAVAFTEAALIKASKPAARAMANAWGTALKRYPTWLEDAPELGTRLMRALVSQGQTVELPFVSSGNGSVSRQLRSTDIRLYSGLSLVMLALGRPWDVKPYSFEHPVGLSPLSMDERRLVAEIAIAFESPHWVQAFAEAAGKGWLDTDIVNRFSGWYEYNQRRPKGINAMGGAWPLVRSIGLEANLPAPSSRRSGPRF